MVLTLDKIIPITAPIGAAANVTLTGTGFSAGATVEINPGAVAATSVVVINATTITCIIPTAITNTKGQYDVELTVGADVETLVKGFVVVPDFPESPFLDETFDVINSRILARLPAKYDVREGSSIYDLVSPLSLEFAEMFVKLEFIRRLVFITQATGTYLDYKAIEVGLVRSPSAKATGTVTFTGTDTTLVPKGTIVSNLVNLGLIPIEFETDEDGTVSGTTVDITVTAVIAGTEGNIVIGAIDVLKVPITNITAVNNAAAMSGGAAEESDSSLRAGILRKVIQPSRGGNIGDYILWAKEADSDVGKVGVSPLAGGDGTVTVAFLKKDDTVPSAGLITTVQDFIAPTPVDEGNGVAPIGANVTIVAASLITVHTTMNISELPGFTASEVQTAVEAAITAHLKALPVGEDVTFHGLAGAIMAVVGVNSITNYLIDFTADPPIAGDDVDLVVTAIQKAVVGNMTFT